MIEHRKTSQQCKTLLGIETKTFKVFSKNWPWVRWTTSSGTWSREWVRHVRHCPSSKCSSRGLPSCLVFRSKQPEAKICKLLLWSFNAYLHLIIGSYKIWYFPFFESLILIGISQNHDNFFISFRFVVTEASPVVLFL